MRILSRDDGGPSRDRKAVWTNTSPARTARFNRISRDCLALTDSKSAAKSLAFMRLNQVQHEQDSFPGFDRVLYEKCDKRTAEPRRICVKLPNCFRKISQPHLESFPENTRLLTKPSNALVLFLCAGTSAAISSDVEGGKARSGRQIGIRSHEDVRLSKK